MAKLKKLGIWSFGVVLALAFVIYQLIQIMVSKLLSLEPLNSYFQALVLENNVTIISIIQWGLVITVSFIFGVILAALYNLISKWVGIKIELAGKK